MMEKAVTSPKQTGSRRAAVGRNIIGSLMAVTAFVALGRIALANGAPATGLYTAFAIGMPIILLASFAHYFYVTDEHDRQANLWSMSAGYMSLVISIISWSLLAQVKVAPPVDVMLAVGLSGVVTVAVWAWLRFR
jgi:hypothetical protein